MMKALVAATVGVVAFVAVDATGQTAAGALPQKRPVPPPSRAASVRVSVKDPDGNPLGEVRLLLSGAGSGEFTTAAAGTAIIPNLKDGLYRVRCERDGFVTLEREFTLRTATQWNPVDIVLTAAPPPPPPPPPPPAPTHNADHPDGGPSITVSVPDFVDKNFIGGREPMKESILACKPLETVRLLQMREAVAAHVHDRADEVLYIVAGEGAVRLGQETIPVRAGSLIVVPHGNSHAFERRGKNPLIVVSTLSGTACEPPKATR